MKTNTSAPASTGTMFLSKREMAQQLGVSVRTLEARTKDGSVPSVKLGRLRKFHAPTVEQTLLANSR